MVDDSKLGDYVQHT